MIENIGKIRRQIIEITKIDCNSIEYPQNLLNINNYPKTLYCIGNVDLLNYNKIIAVVGSRDCTEYGSKYARIFAKEFSKNDICVISGMAIGIDTAAHFGSMLEKGKTIAVLGGGFNDIYPKENEWLFNFIIQNGGCVITEYNNQEKTRLSNFPQRNRIISGIADGILIVEAEYRSGTGITAKYAKKQGKKIFCLPSNIDSKSGIGTNRMIREGATLVTEADQVIKDLYSENKYIQKEKQIMIIPEEYINVYEIIAKKDVTSDEISRILNRNICEINSTLTVMEIEGYIEQSSGNRFTIKRREQCIKDMK